MRPVRLWNGKAFKAARWTLWALYAQLKLHLKEIFLMGMFENHAPVPKNRHLKKQFDSYVYNDEDIRYFQSALCVQQTQRELSYWIRVVLCWPHRWNFALHPTPPLWRVWMPFLSFLLYCAGEIRLLHSSFRHSTDSTGSWQVTRRRIFVFHSEVAPESINPPVNASFSESYEDNMPWFI